MEYRFTKWSALTFATSYNQGFKVIGIFRGDYGLTDGSFKGFIETEAKGTNIAFCLGLKVYPFGHKVVEPKKKEAKIKNQGRYTE